MPANIPNQLRGLWVGFTEYKATHLRPKTITKTYGSKTRLLNRIPIYCSTAKDVVDWLESTYSTESNRRLMQSCIACYEWGIRTDRVALNPFQRYRTHFPKQTKNQRYAFTSEERAAILEAFRLQSPHYYPFVAFCFRTGCRHEEARGLEWEGVKLAHVSFYQAIATHFKDPTPLKTNDTRTFPLTPKIREILDRQRGLSARWVFPSLHDGEPIEPQNFRKHHWVPIVQALQKKGLIDQYLPPKHTRHTFITLALREGLVVTDIARLVGNSASTIWQHYAADGGDIEIEDF